MRVNNQGYVERRKAGRNNGQRPNTTAGRAHSKTAIKYRDWFLVKHGTNNASRIESGNGVHISLPPQYVGKRVRLHVEVLDDNLANKAQEDEELCVLLYDRPLSVPVGSRAKMSPIISDELREFLS